MFWFEHFFFVNNIFKLHNTLACDDQEVHLQLLSKLIFFLLGILNITLFWFIKKTVACEVLVPLLTSSCPINTLYFHLIIQKHVVALFQFSPLVVVLRFLVLSKDCFLLSEAYAKKPPLIPLLGASLLLAWRQTLIISYLNLAILTLR